MTPSYKPVNCGFRVRLMSPLGVYPDQSIVLRDVAFVVSSDLCFSIVRIVEEEWEAEVDSLSPLDIPLLGTLLLSGAGRPYPASGLLLETAKQAVLDSACIDECRHHLLGHIQGERTHARPTAVVHLPPALGGLPYETLDCKNLRDRALDCITRLESADALILRGVGSLLKAEMAWTHGEFADAACIYLWIALDAAHSATLRKLRESGVQNPTAKDASAYFNTVVGFETPWEKFFEEDYSNRIRAIHPDNRFGPEVRPWLIADDFYELRELLIPYFGYLVTGVFVDQDFVNKH
jgi:hypothetical protein